MVFSQNKVSKTVADISVSDTKLHVSYSDGTSKDMDMPPATSLRLPTQDDDYGYTILNGTTGSRHTDYVSLWGTTYYNDGRISGYHLRDSH